MQNVRYSSNRLTGQSIAVLKNHFRFFQFVSVSKYLAAFMTQMSLEGKNFAVLYHVCGIFCNNPFVSVFYFYGDQDDDYFIWNRNQQLLQQN